MNIPKLGPLRRDSRFPELLESEPISVSYFDGLPLTFTLEDLTEGDTEDVRIAIDAFLAMTPEARLAAGQYVFQNYLRIVDAVGADEIDCHVARPEEIWRHVRPSAVFVARRHRRDQLIYIQIAANCDWDREHGLQIVYRRGNELCRVSDQDGHLTHTDAYDLPEDHDRIA